MARIEMFLLGPPRLERDGVPLQFDTRKILALAAYLAVSGMGAGGAWVTRDSMLALLWPDLEPSRARAVLRRNLSLLRTALEGEWLVVEGQMIGTDPQADFWLDVDQFARLVRAWEPHGHPQEQVCPECVEALTEAVALYQGDFLEGFGLRDSVAYDDWQFFQAEELRQALASALERLMQGLCAQGSYQAALPHARRWLALDPLHEPAHRRLMQLYAQTGQRSAALRQYRECAHILEQELGLTPSEETTALYDQIRMAPPAGAAVMLDLTEGPELTVRTALPRHNLPALTTPFVGREEELTDIRARLQDPACRLLTLLGPGGTGKTRLALRLAEALLEAEPVCFEHGVFFVSLAPLRTVEGVVPAVAEALGYSFHTEVEGSARTTPRQQLLDYLRRKQLLLVMDNYEHLLVEGTPGSGQSGSDGIGFVTDVLSTAPEVKILVTSRASLKIQGEYLYPLAGLQVPDEALAGLTADWQALRGYSAVELFIQGGQQVRPDFAPRSRDLAHIARICHLMEGMPLGILLAAAWVEMLTPEEIAAEIQQSLDFLETDLRDVPPRQRSLRAAFDHSWQLLDERERDVFLGLSVFLGGFTREAALEVAGASLRDLMSLGNKSLVHLASRGRYELHEVLRQYGAERLNLEAERAEAVRDRHCDYYSAALERWGAELKDARQREALDEMDLEIENARAAWHWAVAHGQYSHLAQGAEGIWLYHARRLRHQEGEAAFQTATHALEAIGSPEAQRLRARCLIFLSHFHLDQGRKRSSIQTAEQGQALLEELAAAGHDARSELALATFNQARIRHYYCPDPLEAQRYYVQSVALYKEVGDRWGLARALDYLGWTAEQLARFGEARELCEQSLAIRQELGDRHGMADAMLNLGILSWVQGRLDEAHRWLGESAGIFGELDDWIRMAYALKSLGEVLVRRGLFEDGLNVLMGSADIYENMGYGYGVWGLFPFLAEANAHLGRYEDARADARQGAERAERTKHRWSVGFSRFVDGLVDLAEGAHHKALASFQQLPPLARCGRRRTGAGRSRLWAWPLVGQANRSWRGNMLRKPWRQVSSWGPLCR